MQKILVVAALLIAAAVADSNIAYAGTTTNSTSLAVPTFSGTAPITCTPSTTVAPYVTFTFNVTVAGLRSVQVMAEQTLKSSVMVWFYTAFDAANPCNGLFQMKNQDNINNLGGGPVINDVVYFNVGSYTAVVSSTAGASGIFAIHIDIPTVAGSITAASPMYAANTLPYDSSDVCTVCTSCAVAPFAYHQWTATTSELYDFVVALQNDSLSINYVYVNIFAGAQNATTLTGADTCANWVTGAYASGIFIGLYGVNVTAGMTYTVVVSTDQADGYCNYGILAGPTQVRSMILAPTYSQPERHQTTCTDTNGAASWWAYQFTAVGQVYVVDTSAPPVGYVDTYSFMYYGNNAGSATAAPVTCPSGAGSLVVDGDTGDITPVYGFTTPGYNYTVVVSTYSDSVSSGSFILYTFTGTPIGNVPSLTTGTSGVTSATGVSATSTSTTGSQDNSASSAHVAYVVLVAALALLL